MSSNTLIPCPECDRVKYFRGLCYDCTNRKKRERYEQMTREEVNAIITKIISRVEELDDWEEIYEDFSSLLAYQDINTRAIADAAFEKNVLSPAKVYRDASEELQDKLIEQLLKPDCKKAGDLLCCLAEVGSEKVQKVFYELEKNPLPWRKNLYVGPSFYAGLGGWTLDENGKRIDLVYQDCYALERSDRKDEAVKVGEALTENCSVCKCQLVNVLTIDGTDERLAFLGIEGVMQLPACPNCITMSEKTIIRYQLNGKSTFEIIEPYETDNYVTEKEFQQLTNNNLKLSQTKKPVYYSCGNDEVSTIGGIPEWVQDWQYESCPDCQQKMKILSAISWGEVIHGAEGVVYFEICPDCSTVVTIHQQT